MRAFGAPAELQRRRERAINLLEQGYQPVEVAERIGVDRRSVRLIELKKDHPELQKRVVVSMEPRSRIENNGIEVLSVADFLDELWHHKLFKVS